MTRDGVRGRVLTPHLKASEINAGAEPAIARRDAALERLRRHCPAALSLYPGFEIMLDQPLSPLAVGDRRVSLAGVRQFAGPVLRDIARVGLVPVLAHPERYDACSPAAVREWRDAGARMQVDARALGRPSTRGHRARQLGGGGLGARCAARNT